MENGKLIKCIKVHLWLCTMILYSDNLIKIYFIFNPIVFYTVFYEAFQCNVNEIRENGKLIERIEYNIMECLTDWLIFWIMIAFNLNY